MCVFVLEISQLEDGAALFVKGGSHWDISPSVTTVGLVIIIRSGNHKLVQCVVVILGY